MSTTGYSQSHINRPSASQYSRSVSQYISVSDLKELTDEELVKQVTNLKYEIRVLRLENQVLESVIMRVEPTLMHGVQQALDYAVKLQSATSLHVAALAKPNASEISKNMASSPSRIMASPSRISTKRFESSAKVGGTVITGTGVKINVLERSELVSTEMELLVVRLEKARIKAAKQQALLKAQLEEIGVRVSNVEKATESFNQQVIIEGWDPIAQRISAEVWVRYMNEWVKMCDKGIGKLRLRTSTMNSLFTKYKGQIRVKTELSENLRPVDFDLLTIENQVLIETIDKKLLQLSELKKMTGEANLNLAVHKKAMTDQNDYLSKVQKSITHKEWLAKQLDKEAITINEQGNALQLKFNDVKKLRIAYEVPDVMDYVKVKSELTDVKHSVKLLENRFHIQQIALKSLNRKLASMFFE